MASPQFLLLLSFSLLVLGSGCTNEQPTTEKASGATKMVLVSGGTYLMCSKDPRFSNASPLHTVTLQPFYLDEHEVTTAAFAAFVKATYYVTVVERKPDPQEWPGVPKSQLVAGSAVFAKPSHQVSLAEPAQWWQYVAGANLRHPLGPGSSLAGHEKDPVVHVCYEDA
jgi:sulfatase modifying factor 1